VWVRGSERSWSGFGPKTQNQAACGAFQVAPCETAMGDGWHTGGVWRVRGGGGVVGSARSEREVGVGFAKKRNYGPPWLVDGGAMVL